MEILTKPLNAYRIGEVFIGFYTEPPEGAEICDAPPKDGRARWVGGAWVEPDPAPVEVSKLFFIRAARRAGWWSSAKLAIRSNEEIAEDFDAASRLRSDDQAIAQLAIALGVDVEPVFAEAAAMEGAR